ncbi:bubble precursor [Fusarium beomiforme]|uniref:Bubble n=1 Tax=Fusarium beomiforme TaxID=44412 RepID=A0A9P5DRY0_9HYPO|nr:bubble precursor [Fusarium beomiforme]
MKLPILFAAFWAATGTQYVSASPLAENELTRRNDCGKGGAPYTRRTNSPCGPGNGNRAYCGCDRTGVVQCLHGFWKEIQNCEVGTYKGCTANGSGAQCRVVLG